MAGILKHQGLQQLGERLRKQRRQNGQTIAEIARHHKINSNTYRAIERGQRRPRVATCHFLASFLNTEPKEIIALVGYDISAYTLDGN
jgi:transcriptional regulator with XRE-family HTH domain